MYKRIQGEEKVAKLGRAAVLARPYLTLRGNAIPLTLYSQSRLCSFSLSIPSMATAIKRRLLNFIVLVMECGVNSLRWMGISCFYTNGVGGVSGVSDAGIRFALYMSWPSLMGGYAIGMIGSLFNSAVHSVLFFFFFQVRKSRRGSTPDVSALTPPLSWHHPLRERKVGFYASFIPAPRDPIHLVLYS